MPGKGLHRPRAVAGKPAGSSPCLGHIRSGGVAPLAVFPPGAPTHRDRSGEALTCGIAPMGAVGARIRCPLLPVEFFGLRPVRGEVNPRGSFSVPQGCSRILLRNRPVFFGGVSCFLHEIFISKGVDQVGRVAFFTRS